MNIKRVPATDRRAAIIAAIRPLVACKGFNGTTTREMAAAAGVSEALIFKHFPTKQALYDAVVQSSTAVDPEIARLLSMVASTDTLVHTVRLLVRYFAVEVPANIKGKQGEHRLALANLLEDGQLYRQRYDWIAHHLQPLFAASVREAEAAGDVVPSPVPAENRLLFAEHLGSMFASLHLGASPIAPHTGDATDHANQMTWFLLRAIGFTDAAIAAHCGTPAQTTEKGRVS